MFLRPVDESACPIPRYGGKVAEHSASLIGQRIGTYTILSLLGAGGMGEVYRAHDEKLQRDVAIKILPPKFTADPDRAARFEREARVLATLNHPSIAAIYGYVEFGGVRGLVLELVEGPTLLDRIASSPLPVPEALAIGIQVAEALEAAHEKGIIHRDLKPANIKVAPDGRVKVLDFGLATTFDVDPIRSDRSDAATMTASPTHAGLILGTVAYMSPEQTRGGPVDKRTDIWAFGCVLYEMLTGRTPFFSATASDVMAGILEREPNWDTLPPKTPPQIRHLLERCLEKDTRRRLRDIGDARLELIDAIGAPASSHRPTRVRPRCLAWKFVAFATAALILGAAAVWSGIARYFSATTEHRLSDGNRPSPNTEANAYYERALLFGGAGTADPDQARRMIERALALDSKFAGARAENAFYQVAPILNGRSNDPGLFYKAESEVRQALHDDPRCGRAHSVLALIYLLQGRKELVPGELDLALKENPDDITAHSWLLSYHRFNGDYTRAREEADWLIRRLPTYWPAYLDRGELLREQGDTAGAIREQQRVLEQDPRNGDALASLVRAHIAAAELRKARQALERADAQQFQNYEVRLVRALLLAREGNRNEAIQEMDSGLQTYAGIQIFGPAAAADVYAVLGDTDVALQWLDRAVRMGDDREEYLRRNPLLTNLRSHPRFQQILDAVAYRRQQRAAR
jgi:serine/threonine protein kinase/Tfp pilus assembly protein PilF